MPMCKPGAESEQASSQFQGPTGRLPLSQSRNKLSLSRFLEFFCVNAGFAVSANWMLGAF
ncbi:GPI mannosyltransferase 1, partial [Clarias magur]